VLDLGKKNDGAFGSSIELMPIDYAIGVGTFRPNNAIVFNEGRYKLMSRVMKERHQTHDVGMYARGFTLLDRECRRSKDGDARADSGDPPNPDRLPGRWRHRWIGQQGKKRSSDDADSPSASAATHVCDPWPRLAHFHSKLGERERRRRRSRSTLTEWSPDSRRDEFGVA
jgi:hypothetical protein